jgi:hypothetical protein
MSSRHRFWRFAGLLTAIEILTGVAAAQTVTITQLSPTSVQAGSGDFTLKVFGTNIPTHWSLDAPEHVRVPRFSWEAW